MTLEQSPQETSGKLSAAPKRIDVRRFYLPVIFIPLFYAIVRYWPPEVFFALVVGTTWLALAEFYRLHFGSRPQRLEIALGALATGLLLAIMQWPDVVSDRALLVALIIGVLAYGVARSAPLNRTLADCAVLTLGILYVGLTMGHVVLLRKLPDGIFLIFFLAAVTWAGDTGAYFAGRTLGRHKLAPHISPNKTVEGVVGGAVLALLVALLARTWFLPSLTLRDCLVAGILLAGVGVLGDLVESMLKRSAGVKDSGHLIPGHGGMLDRVDSLLFTAPVFYYYVVLVRG